LGANGSSSQETSNPAGVTLAECADACTADATCVAFDYMEYTQDCYLNMVCEIADDDNYIAWRGQPIVCECTHSTLQPVSRPVCIAFSANTCDDDNIANAVTGADYTSCTDGEITGATCMAVCGPGYTTATSAAGFVLSCDSSGDFDGADGSLDCIGMLR
jgi:hypothetical protein